MHNFIIIAETPQALVSSVVPIGRKSKYCDRFFIPPSALYQG
ncbi:MULTISPECIES: hypothetical protein [unclassified Moorena]|nr:MULTISPECIES: hypothetical protein [unclassified Moorena]